MTGSQAPKQRFKTLKARIIIAVVAASFLIGLALPFFPDEPIVQLLAVCPMLLLAVSWCVYDAEERDIALGVILKLAIFLFFAIGMPIYLFKTRGWNGWIAIAIMVGICFLVQVALNLGEHVTLSIGDAIGYWDYSPE